MTAMSRPKTFGSLRKVWRSWPVDRRLSAVATIALVAASFVVVGYTTAKRPGDKGCPPPCSLDLRAREAPETRGTPAKQRDQTVNWPMFGYDEARTKYFPTDGVKPPFRPIWGWDSGELLEFAPIVVDDVLYGVKNDGTMFALDARDNGKVLWQKSAGKLAAMAPAYSHGVLYGVTLEPGSVFAMRAKDGKMLWQRDMPGRVESSPVVHNGRVIVGCECAAVYRPRRQGRVRGLEHVDRRRGQGRARDLKRHRLRRRLRRADVRATRRRRRHPMDVVGPGI